MSSSVEKRCSSSHVGCKTSAHYSLSSKYLPLLPLPAIFLLTCWIWEYRWQPYQDCLANFSARQELSKKLNASHSAVNIFKCSYLKANFDFYGPSQMSSFILCLRFHRMNCPIHVSTSICIHFLCSMYIYSFFVVVVNMSVIPYKSVDSFKSKAISLSLLYY